MQFLFLQVTTTDRAGNSIESTKSLSKFQTKDNAAISLALDNGGKPVQVRQLLYAYILFCNLQACFSMVHYFLWFFFFFNGLQNSRVLRKITGCSNGNNTPCSWLVSIFFLAHHMNMEPALDSQMCMLHTVTMFCSQNLPKTKEYYYDQVFV